jgi:predicted anti-sigma-YlaC factor YlaD
MKRLITIPARRLYAILSGDDSLDRNSSNISKSDFTHQARNFMLNLANGSCSKLAEQLAGPNLVLVWLLQCLGAPVWMLGMLMPIKQTGTLLPQMAAAGQIRRVPVRKWVWVGSGLIQALCLGGIITAAALLPGVMAGWFTLILFTLFCLASGTASVAYQDLLGKTISKGRRGRLLASRSLVGGLLTIGAGLGIRATYSGNDNLDTILILIGCAALLWALAALLFGASAEEPGATGGSRHILQEARAGFEFARLYPGFRHYIYARSLLLSVEIASPFFVLFASTRLEFGTESLGYLVVGVGISQVISSPFWGKMADNTSKTVMRYSGLMAVAAIGLTLSLPLLPGSQLQLAGFILTFIILGLAEAGARLGRKTYLVDALPADERPTYTAFSNTLVGGVALASAGLGAVAHLFGAGALLLLLALFALGASLVCIKLPEAEAMLD